MLITPRTKPVWVCPNCWFLKTYRKQPQEPQRCLRCMRARYRPLPVMVDECGVDHATAEAAYRLNGIQGIRDLVEQAWDDLPHA